MIPTMVIVGLVLGRWWRTALVVGALLWPAVLIVAGTISSVEDAGLAALLGLGNSAVGVVLHQLALRGVRAAQRRAR